MKDNKNIDINKLINLSVDIWRLGEKISKIVYLKDQDNEKISVSLDRLKKFIKDLDIELKGFSGEKYSEEINFYELKATEDTNFPELDGIIKDTIEPAVINNGNIIKQAKIIVYKFTP
ncbi:hypothetical protein [Candidatus Vampirococcus lugosii]|uniref:Uncharacterized protein n=1 Tax=Candidatus Vampirococcus lugosii TaxID=2789015 RepID=A0ABS5QNB7_9BACT|nr:hypothetical protein [Candidatus Vampirococcus lugosii]MBS8122198.1 hypothetical protein [Candidatus Vampirococcus lugosii]